MPMYSQTDLRVQHEFKLGGSQAVAGRAQRLNLFNQRTATNRFVTMHKTNGISFDETEFYKGNVNFDALIAAIPLDPAVPDGQRVPDAYPGTLRRPVPVLG